MSNFTIGISGCFLVLILDPFIPILLFILLVPPTHSRRPINVDQFLHGRVFGVESSHVIAHVTDDGVITAVIRVGDDSYYIEVRYCNS